MVTASACWTVPCLTQHTLSTSPTVREGRQPRGCAHPGTGTMVCRLNGSQPGVGLGGTHASKFLPGWSRLPHEVGAIAVLCEPSEVGHTATQPLPTLPRHTPSHLSPQSRRCSLMGPRACTPPQACPWTSSVSTGAVSVTHLRNVVFLTECSGNDLHTPPNGSNSE